MRLGRRQFFGWMGATPLAAKAAVDAQIGALAGLSEGGLTGLGNTSLGIGGHGPPGSALDTVPYETRLIGAGDYVRMFGIPEWMEFEYRDNSRYVTSLDPDIASKRTWSMAVKIMTQRQRNYERQMERMKRAGWTQRGRASVKKFLGFDWPW